MILNLMQEEGDSLPSTINRLLRLGCVAYGRKVPDVTAEKRTVSGVLSASQYYFGKSKVKMPGFRASRSLVEALRDVQGTRRTGDILAQALDLWVTTEKKSWGERPLIVKDQTLRRKRLVLPAGPKLRLDDTYNTPLKLAQPPERLDASKHLQKPLKAKAAKPEAEEDFA